MTNLREHPQKIRLAVKESDSKIAEVKAPTGQRIGHVISGQSGGPTLFVAGSGARVRSAYQRLLFLPSLRRMRGRLVLLHLDALGPQQTQLALSAAAASLGPVADTLFLDGTAKTDRAGTPRQGDDLFDTVLRFLSRHDIGSVDRRIGAPVIRDFAC